RHGVTHAVTQACSMGDLLQCGCEATRKQGTSGAVLIFPPWDGVKWEWGGLRGMMWSLAVKLYMRTE
ncbi:hypothetical protein KUCAC02_009964, partial [Chaenocephalus aceratus]